MKLTKKMYFTKFNLQRRDMWNRMFLSSLPQFQSVHTSKYPSCRLSEQAAQSADSLQESTDGEEEKLE